MKELKFNGNRMIVGPGSIQAIEGIKGQRFSIITGKRAMFDNGTIDGIIGILKAQGKACDVYSGIGANPTVAEVEEGAKRLKAFDPDVVLAVGGGSAIDAAKVMTLLCEYKTLTIEEIRNGQAPETRQKITLVAAPSTSGTASEVTRAAVVTFEDENIKVGLKTLAFIPDIAILDGNLTLSMPGSVVAETGMDALTHALESYINPNADDFCKPISRAAAE
ncbi:MAG: iron-containing alcohol dehydrogenase, partial [Eubacterium sp.]